MRTIVLDISWCAHSLCNHSNISIATIAFPPLQGTTTVIIMVSSRHTYWFSVAAFSTIVLVSFVNYFPSGEDITDQPDHTKWALSAVSIALSFSAIAVFSNLLLKERFEGKIMEGGLVRIIDDERGGCPKQLYSHIVWCVTLLYLNAGCFDMRLLGKRTSSDHGS